MAELKRKVSLKQKHGAVEESPPPAPPPKKSKWWLWAIPALVVVAGVIIYLLATGDSSSPDKTVEITPQQQTTPGTPASDSATSGGATPAKPADTLKPETKPAAPPLPYKKGEAYKVYQFPFGDGSYSKPDPELEKLVKVMTENKDVKIQIYAYTDKVGSVGFNQALSDKRAKAIYDYLVSKGIDKSRLAYQGKGILTKYGSNAENRRAEFVLQ
jgi:outer membrane protein OmpA-like peptidoglycan-associated protein